LQEDAQVWLMADERKGGGLVRQCGADGAIGGVAGRELLEQGDRRAHTAASEPGGQQVSRLARAHERTAQDLIDVDTESCQAARDLAHARDPLTAERALRIVAPLGAARFGDRVTNQIADAHLRGSMRHQRPPSRLVPFRMRIAAIDIGTNSLHMIVCQVRPDLSFEVIDREKDMVQLGRGGFTERRLHASSMAAAIQTLSKFLRIAAARGVEEVIASATSAVREAENGGDFVAEIQRRLGLAVRVIPGTEEARLIHLAAVNAVDTGRRPAIVIDIGGGSTEITLGTADRLMLARSFKLGVIRLMDRFGGSEAMSAGHERKLVRHIRRELDGFLEVLGRRRFDKVIGTSGTILSLGALATGAAPGVETRLARVPAKAIARVRRRLVAASLPQRLRLPGLDQKRAELAPVGAVLLDTLLQALEVDDLTLCDYALREGLILDYIDRNARHIKTVERYPDVRRRSVIELAERCNYLADHARQVAWLSLALFDATRARHGLGPVEREWLEYGALLHDIGTHIGYERHHRHSYYLVRHGGLRGFDGTEVERIALVARYHRQSTPKKTHAEMAGLARGERRAIALLAAFVRLAEGLDRSHAQVVAGLTMRQRGGRLTVNLRTRGDAELELWAAARHAAPLGELLDVEIDVVRAPRRRRQTPGRA
jgi:exopolyphosphatase/guanosine-5'-triphosphate,3'-diphosphate pyrophosphatase